MKCPHCSFAGRCRVIETRETPDGVYRRRSCGNCGRAFVSREDAPVGLKMPSAHNNRVAPDTRNARRRTTSLTTSIRATGAHLQGVWSLQPKEN